MSFWSLRAIFLTSKTRLSLFVSLAGDFLQAQEVTRIQIQLLLIVANTWTVWKSISSSSLKTLLESVENLLELNLSINSHVEPSLRICTDLYRS